MNTTHTGVILDPRTEVEKAKDFQADELVTFALVDWKEKPKAEWNKFPIRDQNGSLTCVAQTGAKVLGIENHLEESKFIEFSARDIYERRANKPSGGMWGQNALSIMSQFGATLEEKLPSQNMHEYEIEAPFVRTEEDLTIAKKYRGGGYVQLPIDIDKVADVVLNQKKAVMIYIFGDYSEWDVVIPKINKPETDVYSAYFRHAITVVDAFLYNGEKCVLIEDSWGKGFGEQGQRIVTETFFKSRVYFAGYLLNLSNEAQQTLKPKHTFTKILKFGMRNTDVKALQDILKYEGVFPVTVSSTGNYFQVTAKGVLAFQRKHNVAGESELAKLNGMHAGPKTVAKLNQLYS